MERFKVKALLWSSLCLGKILRSFQRMEGGLNSWRQEAQLIMCDSKPAQWSYVVALHLVRRRASFQSDTFYQCQCWLPCWYCKVVWPCQEVKMMTQTVLAFLQFQEACYPLCICFFVENMTIIWKTSIQFITTNYNNVQYFVGSWGNPFQILGVLNKQLDKTHRKGGKGMHLFKVNGSMLCRMRVGW